LHQYPDIAATAGEPQFHATTTKFCAFVFGFFRCKSIRHQQPFSFAQ
jgi:hypothetical protein